MPIVETLAPLILLIALGAGLAHIKFLGSAFMADLNKLAFWIALPALLFTSANHAGEPGSQLGWLLGVVFGGTILITLIALGVSFILRMPGNVRGTLMQSAFRGNLAYIGIPVLAYSFSELPGTDGNRAMATAVVVMVLTMAFYNILAVIVLQASQHTGNVSVSQLGKLIATNPLLIAGILGLLVPLLDVQLPKFVNSALQSLGSAAVPIALLCIGGSLATTTLKGRISWIFTAASLKVIILPCIIYGLAQLAGLGPAEQRIALVLTSCPTAAAAFVMAKEMGGDTALASGSIALSTLLSGVSLAVVLWVTS